MRKILLWSLLFGVVSLSLASYSKFSDHAYTWTFVSAKRDLVNGKPMLHVWVGESSFSGSKLRATDFPELNQALESLAIGESRQWDVGTKKRAWFPGSDTRIRSFPTPTQ